MTDRHDAATLRGHASDRTALQLASEWLSSAPGHFFSQTANESDTQEREDRHHAGQRQDTNGLLLHSLDGEIGKVKDFYSMTTTGRSAISLPTRESGSSAGRS